MARKILISAIGTGRKERDSADFSREYIDTEYRFGDTIYKSSFVTRVIQAHLAIKTVFYIGTVRSMWEEVYKQHAEANGEFDEHTWVRIADAVSACTWKSPLDAVDFSPIEKELGDGGKIIPVRYGITDEENIENFTNIMKIADYLEDGDCIYLDITHSFRSLAFNVLSVLMYARDVLQKAVSVSGIYYGMLDVAQELGFAPIVELNYAAAMFDWSKAAYAFSEYGNAYEITKLINEQNNVLAGKLERFSDAMNMNNTAAVRDHIRQLNKCKHEKMFDALTGPAAFIVPKTVYAFLERFSDTDSGAMSQVKLAQWHAEHKHYGIAYILMLESIITFLCEQQKCVQDDKEARDRMREWLYKNKYKEEELFEIYKTVNDVRITIAHATEKRKDACISDIQNLQKRLDKLQKRYLQG